MTSTADLVSIPVTKYSAALAATSIKLGEPPAYGDVIPIVVLAQRQDVHLTDGGEDDFHRVDSFVAIRHLVGTGLVRDQLLALFTEDAEQRLAAHTTTGVEKTGHPSTIMHLVSDTEPEAAVDVEPPSDAPAAVAPEPQPEPAQEAPRAQPSDDDVLPPVKGFGEADEVVLRQIGGGDRQLARYLEER